MRTTTLLSALALLCCQAVAQVTVEVRIDSLQLLVGEQTGITLEVTCPAGNTVTLPHVQRGQELVPDVEVVRVGNIDTVKLNKGERMQLSQKYIVTAWDSALYYLPPMAVTVDGKEYLSKGLALKVATLDVDTLHTDRFYGPKDIMPAPFAWQDWRMAVWGSFAAVLLAMAAALLYASLRTGQSLMRIVRRKPRKPAHEVALTRIDQIKQQRVWAQEDSKEYYTQLTDTLRTYIQDRYGFQAMEMTSTEIIERLTQENDEQALRELRELFQTADLVKFAKHSTLINENDANLLTALHYIDQTKQIELPPEEVVEQTPRQRRRRATTIALKVAVATLAAAALAAIVCVAWRVVDLLI